jgi:hypothetical protein
VRINWNIPLLSQRFERTNMIEMSVRQYDGT